MDIDAWHGRTAPAMSLALIPDRIVPDPHVAEAGSHSKAPLHSAV